LDKNDIVSRFFHEKASFEIEEMQGLSQIDYIKDLTIIALVGEVGFGRVVGVGEYFLDQAKNMAEVAFSISREFQGKGLGKILIGKLATAARENGISGLIAYTSSQNQGMIRLFKSLPYRVTTSFEGDILILSCRFDEIST
jgi:RimJ/RimL family protein N-acetyltransferase